MVKRDPFTKSIFRDIRKSFGRFFAILIIIALGVGFFVGLRITQPSMIATADKYLKDLNFYDFRLVSTLGFTKDDIDAFDKYAQSVSASSSASGAYLADLVASIDSSDGMVLKAHSMTESTNKLSLKYGRLPEKASECILDSKMFGEDMIGKTLTVTEAEEGTFKIYEFVIVGTASSPLYLNFERGTSSLGNGSVKGFVYFTEEAFSSQVYHEVYLDLPVEEEIYSIEYDTAIDKYRFDVETLLSERADIRYNQIVEAAKKELQPYEESYNKYLDMYNSLPDSLKTPEMKVQLEEAEAMLEEKYKELESLKPSVYTLDRSMNVGYACFENDSSIVKSISAVFPLFFLLVAALVCSTTMTRMVDECRSEIGTFKALGYSNAKIQSKFLIYSGLAALFGWIIGYFIGSFSIPKILWSVYGILYGFTKLEFVFSPTLFILCFLCAILCSCGAAFFACRAELFGQPANIMRPRSPKIGKNILLERIRPIWNKMSFLHKVSARNIFRYKTRLVMMLIGIGGCTALLITGFGIQDSIQDIVSYQFTEIMTYDFEVRTDTSKTENVLESILENDDIKNALPLYQSSMELHFGEQFKSVTLLSSEDGFDGYADFHASGKSIPHPSKNEVIISKGTAKLLGIKEGDTITLRDSNMKEAKLKVSGVFENYIYNYAVISEETFTTAFGYEPSHNTIFINADTSSDSVGSLTAYLSKQDGVISVTANEDMITRMDSTMKSISYIVVLVVVCASSLAFVVIYNLTNINIAERVREIATIKVLGFTSRETSAYVFREIVVLTASGAVLGIPLGILLHRFVMSQIKIDLVCFENRINLTSFVISLALTLLFALIINIFMIKKLEKIDMAQSLKSVE